MTAQDQGNYCNKAYRHMLAITVLYQYLPQEHAHTHNIPTLQVQSISVSGSFLPLKATSGGGQVRHGYGGPHPVVIWSPLLNRAAITATLCKPGINKVVSEVVPKQECLSAPLLVFRNM